ncbi:hypothetical protein PG2000B_1082 [Bifidobacterium pseudolongum subsp. globosum]|uniref:hypothetical protein n=1 Tax=Bifidobacterium pseudolongum TaxID=1694 RepID=UPI001020EA80|nr:hypothetical protein [Bifidobacterium pseudolongum]RYQ42389.1 hypothetical protein PG2000B_1082 [Bifidobacterium pseudolongum subsp. globosum]
MARHIELNPDNAMKVIDIASTALQTARQLQTRKAANVYIPSGDGTGVLIGDTAEHGGISRYDPESETQSPLWEGISQEELDAKADEILGAAKEDTAAQITVVNTTITEVQQAIEVNREGLEQEASLRAEADKAATAATNAVKAETDKLKGDYADMSTDVDSVKQDMLDMVQRVEIAQTTADGKNRRFVQATTPTVPAAELTQGDEWWQTSSEPPETYLEGEPNNSGSVLVGHSGEVEHILTWNGTRWVDLMLAADSLFVRGTISAGLVSADFFDGAIVKGGAFITSNELIQLNNSGFFVEDAQGNPVVTINAANGDATFRSVNIIGAGISTPEISGGSIEGADYKLTTGSGESKTTVAQINSDGILFGDHLSYAKNEAGQWVLSLNGAIQSGGEISGPVITAPTIQTSSAENTGLKFTTGGLVAFDANGNTTFTLDNTGGIMMAGALMSNSEIVSSSIHTSPDADNRVSITSAGLTVTHGGQTVISFAADGAVDLGTSGIAADSRVSDLTDEVHDSYTPLNVFEQTADALGESVTNVQTQVGATADRLDEEIDARKQYMQFDPNNGLTIGDLTNTDAYSVQLTSTAMQFRAGNTVAAYVSNDRLYINNAEVVNTLRIGNFAFLPRDNGHMSLQYVGGSATVQEV